MARPLASIIVRCGEAEPEAVDADSSVLLAAVRDHAVRSLAWADSRLDEFSVTTFPLGGPSRMLLVASRTRLSDPASAAAYLTRCKRLPAHLDQYTDVVRAAARGGLLPVAPLVDDALRQVREHLSHPERDPMLSRQPPEGWDGAAAWQDEVEQVVARRDPPRHRSLCRSAGGVAPEITAARAGGPASRAGRRGGVRVQCPGRHDAPARPR